MSESNKTNSGSNAAEQAELEKKKNRGYIIKFIIFMVICLVMGYVAGAVLAIVRNSGINFEPAQFYKYARIVLSIAHCIFPVVLIGISLAVYSGNVKKAKEWDGEDEEFIDKIEARQNIPLTLSSILSIGGLFMFAAWVITDLKIDAKTGFDVWSIIGLSGFLMSLAGAIIIQYLTINLEKKLNPEKEGNVFDFQFIRKWERSSDEAEKMIQAKACKKAYYVANGTCVLMWLISFMVMVFNKSGFLAVACVCIIWLVMNLTYALEVMRMENKSKVKKQNVSKKH